MNFASPATPIGVLSLLTVMVFIHRNIRRNFDKRERLYAWALALICTLIITHFLGLVVSVCWTLTSCLSWWECPSWTQWELLIAFALGLFSAPVAGSRLDDAFRNYWNTRPRNRDVWTAIPFGWALLIVLSSSYMLGFAFWRCQLLLAGRAPEAWWENLCMGVGLGSAIPWLPFLSANVVCDLAAAIADRLGWFGSHHSPRKIQR
jgi:hypothetical protein